MKEFKGVPFCAVDEHVFQFDGSDVAAVCADGYSFSEDYELATLFSAAPELLSALLELIFLYEHDEGCRDLTEYKRAKVAINKALGGSQ